MAKSKKQEITPEVQDVKEAAQEQGVLVTFSDSTHGRFQVENHQAFVKPSELKEDEKFIEANGKTYIKVTIPTHSYLL